MDFTLRRAPVRYRLNRIGRPVGEFLSDLPYYFYAVPTWCVGQLKTLFLL